MYNGDVNPPFQFNLVCDKEHLTAQANGVYWAGVIIGLLIGGHMADRYVPNSFLLAKSRCRVDKTVLLFMESTPIEN